MKSHYRVVVVGGGVVGSSVLYHLAKFGWTDVVMLERSVLTAGSSWHAAGGIHALNADPNMAALQAYTIDLLSEVEKESGQNIGLHMTGGLTLAGTPERWEWLQANYRIFQSIGIDDCALMSPEEAQKRCPIMSTEGVLGAMWADREGYIDTTGTVHAYAISAKKRGAEYYEHTKVEELNQTPDGWEVVTDKGTITCEHVINAAGLWAKQVGRMAGIELPVSPLKHHYLVSDTIPEVAALDFEVPMTVDLEGFTYMRQDQNGILLGIYEIDHEHWAMDGAPWDYGMELFQEQTDRIENELIMGFERYPALQEVGVKTWVNGAFTFSPDGNPLVGPVPGKRGYWCACAVMAGFLQGGGVGKTIAEWMIHGEPEADAWPMDVARYGKFAENKQYIRETTGQFYSRRFVMSYPNEQLPAGRPLKMAPAHDAMTADGCRWGVSWDLETPLYFAPSDDFVENLTLKRSNAHDIVAAECRNARDNVGMVDITGFSRYQVTGPNAETWLDRMMASNLPRPGRARLAPMLAENGRLKGDLTIFNWGDGTWWIMGSYYLRAWHMRWFSDHLEDGVHVRDLGEEMCGFGLTGPNSRKVIEKLTDQDIAALPFMGCGDFDIGLVRARVGRMSVAGELGFEVNCRMGDHIKLRRILLKAGEEFGLKEYGFNAMLSMRLEKSFGIWSAEFRQEYTPGETGMDRWIAWDKSDFNGKAAATAERDGNGPNRKLVTLDVDADDADASGYEPIWSRGDLVGFVTSGGYGHTVKKSLAMALVNTELATEGQQLSVHVVGKERAARVIAPSPYDPEGRAMRGMTKKAVRIRSSRRSRPQSEPPPERQVDYHNLKNPFPPMAVFSDDRIVAIHDAALSVLEDLGIKVLLPEARDMFVAGGASLKDDDMIYIGRDMIEAAIASAPRSIQAKGAVPKRDIIFEPGRLVFQPGAGAPHATDLVRGRRPGTGDDFKELVRLTQHFDVLQMMPPLIEPQDVPTNVRHYFTAHVQLTLSDKLPFIFARGTPQVAESFEMLRDFRGLSDEALRSNVYSYTIINTNSPRQLDIPMAQGLIDFARAGQLAVVTPFTLMGAMAPITVAGALTLSHAEALAAITLSQLARPGAPVCYGTFTSNVDMKSGAPALGTPEHFKASLAAGQLARLIDLPWRCASGSAANLGDAQAANETQFGLWGCLLAGSTIVIHAAGWLESGLTVSYEKLITDLEVLQMVAELCANTPAGEAEIGLDALAEVQPGGHFFATGQTMARYKTEFYQPLVADWSNFGTWEENGALDATTRATAVWQRILAEEPTPQFDDAKIGALTDYIRRQTDAGGAYPVS